MESVDVPVFGRIWGRSGMLSRYGISCYTGFFFFYSPYFIFFIRGVRKGKAFLFGS